NIEPETLAGDPILTDETEPLAFNAIEFSDIENSRFQLAVASVYSPTTSLVHYSEIPIANWREEIKRLFRPVKIAWHRQAIKIQKPDLNSASALRLPASVISLLDSAE